MLKRLTDSFRNRRKAGKDFRAVFVAVVLLFVLGFVFQIFFSERLIYFLCGYDYALFFDRTNKWSEAYNATRRTRETVGYIFVAITHLCWVFSAAALYLRLYLGCLTVLVFGFTSLLMLLFGAVFFYGPFSMD